MRFRGSALLAAAFASAPGALLAQSPPLGGEFQINTTTTGRQDSVSVASSGHGTFVVAWRSASGGRSDQSVFGQRFNPQGQKTGGEFPASEETSFQQRNPAVGMDGSGNFVLIWEGPGATLQFDIQGHRFGSAGSPVGSEFLVNTATAPSQINPAVAADRTGRFVAVWQSGSNQDGSSVGVFGQRFDAAGNKVGGEFPVNTYTTGPQSKPAIGMDDAGNFVVVWQSSDQDGSDYGVFGQRFDAAGAKVGSEFAVNTYTTGRQGEASVEVGRRGDFVVVWENAQFGGGLIPGIFGQRFNSSAEKVGDELEISTNSSAAQKAPSVARDRAGGFVVAWQNDVGDYPNPGIVAQRYDRAGVFNGPAFPVNVFTTGAQTAPKVVDDGSGFAVVWESENQDGDDQGLFGRRQHLRPGPLAVDAHGIGTSDLNGVLEPLEAVVVEPTWINATSSFVALNGTVSNLTGLPGPTYTLLDSAGSYGIVSPNALGSCNDGSPGACFAIQLGSPRPAQHWDAFLVEDLSGGGTQVWTLHVGDSFTDVPRSQPFYRKIETLFHHGITTGCTAGDYCPGDPVTRDQMAIFLAKALAGSGELVPDTGRVGSAPYSCADGTTLFGDVSSAADFCRHVHYLAAQNVTLGCGPATFCPGQTVTRDAMASFIAKAIVAPGGGNAVPTTYGPDPTTARSYSCAAGSPSIHFTDVPVSNPFCKHIHFLWAKGIVDGCSATQYCPAAAVARDAMAKFISNGFELALYPAEP